jgi:predicted small metal-binding protein
MTHRYACDACSFELQSPTDDELVDVVREHAKDEHGTNVSRAEVNEGWEDVEAAGGN